MEITRVVQQRAEFLIEQNYVKIAATRGWSKWKILRTHIIRNTLPYSSLHDPFIYLGHGTMYAYRGDIWLVTGAG